MKKTEKLDLVKKLTDTLKSAKSTVFVNFAGLTVKDQQDLKKLLREQNAQMGVFKNTFIKIAAKEAGYPEEALTDTVLTQQTAIVYSEADAVAPVQILGKYIADNEKPQFKAGVIEGQFTDSDGLIRISKLPGKETLYAQVVGGMSAPMYALVGTMQANLQKLVFVLDSYKNSKQE